MQARLEIKRFPSMLVVLVFALAAALLVGGALGYNLKPTSLINGPARVFVLPNGGSSVSDSCVIVDKHKAC